MDHEIKLNGGTVYTASTIFGNFGESTQDRVIYISDSSTLLVDEDIHCDAIAIGTDGTTLANETGILKFRAPNKIRFKDVHPLTTDPRIVWCNDGEREVDRGSGLKVQNLCRSGTGDGTKSATLHQSGPGTVSAANRVLWYTMQDYVLSGGSVGQFKDMPGGHATLNHAGVSAGMILSNVPGRFGRAIEFTGFTNNTFLLTADETSLDVTTFTIAVWVKPYSTASTAEAGIICKDGAYEISQRGTSCEVTTWVAAVARTDVFTNVFTANTWTHLVFVYDAAKHYLYVNGVQKTPVTRVGTVDNSIQGLTIGTALHSQFVASFNGVIDDPAIWNVVLPAAEIATVSEGGPGEWAGYVWDFHIAAGQSITVSNHDDINTREASFCAWVKQANEATMAIASKITAPPNSQGWEFATRLDNGLTVNIYGATSMKRNLTITVAGLSLINAWHHVGFTYDGYTIRIFLDGAVVGTRTYTSYMPIGDTSAASFKLGTSPGFINNWDGYMDEMYLFNAGLLAGEMQGYWNLKESPCPRAGLSVTETGSVVQDSTLPSSLATESNRFWGFESQAIIPRSNWGIQYQGSAFSGFSSTGSPSGGQNYSLKGHSPGFTLQTSSSLSEDYSFEFDSMAPLSVEDTGGDKPMVTTIQRVGNVSRVKKIGFSPRKVTYRVRINLNEAGGLTQLRRLQEVSSTLYKESDVFNIYTDKHILIGYQLTDYNESPVRSAPWKVIDVEIEFTKRVL